MRRTLGCLAAVGLLCGVVGQANASSLVVNGGFETGDFTAWATMPAAAVGDFRAAGCPQTGNDLVLCAAAASPLIDGSWQDLTTMPDDNRTIDYGAAGPDPFEASGGGTVIPGSSARTLARLASIDLALADLAVTAKVRWEFSLYLRRLSADTLR